MPITLNLYNCFLSISDKTESDITEERLLVLYDILDAFQSEPIWKKIIKDGLANQIFLALQLVIEDKKINRVGMIGPEKLEAIILEFRVVPHSAISILDLKFIYSMLTPIVKKYRKEIEDLTT